MACASWESSFLGRQKKKGFEVFRTVPDNTQQPYNCKTQSISEISFACVHGVFIFCQGMTKSIVIVIY